MKQLASIRVAGVEVSLSLHGRTLEALRRMKASLRGSNGAAAAPAAPEPPRSPEGAKLFERIQGVPWYHTLDLGHGVVTPGFFDHRPALPYYHLPADLTGLRVLDVATYNGFWAFEFERRGASEVVALDIEKAADIDLAPARRAQMTPEELAVRTGLGFEIAREVFGSKVRREICNVYDLSPERFGTFDLVFCGDLMVHLSNPIRALQRIRSVTKGFAVLTEMYDEQLERGPDYRLMNYMGGMNDYVWWMFSFGAYRQMIRDAGFGDVRLMERAFPLLPRGYTTGPPHALFHAYPAGGPATPEPSGTS
ncbi:MAG TPA: hypothetical protein DEH78_21020 [Solibacterales bacterium]|nr:hypothetical protein [Bryobacterales bacterium]